MTFKGEKDYYKILGVFQISSLEAIQKGYRTASKRYHPDVNPELKQFSEDKMRQLVEAYEVLSDPEKRKEYDRQPHYQLRKSKRTSTGPSPKAYTRMPTLSEEYSLKHVFLRIFRRILGKKSTASTEVSGADAADVHFTLGYTLAENVEFYDQAVEEFQRAFQYDPKFVEAAWNIGILLYRQGLFKESILQFQKVLALNREDAMAQKIISLMRD